MLTTRIDLGLALSFAILTARAVYGDDAREAPAPSFPVLAGIGVALSMTDDGPQVGMVLSGSSAEESGKLNQGDRLLSIRNGESTIDLKGKPMGEVVSLIRGPVGTTVTLEVLSKSRGSRSLVTLKREAVPLQGRPPTYNELIGKPSPVTRFSTLDQSAQIALSRYARQVVVIDFWASWCGTCYAPVDRLQTIARAHPEWKGRVALLTVAIDAEPQAASRVIKARNWKETTHLSLAPEELAAVKILNVPAVLILSSDGKVAVAGDPHAIDVEKEISGLLSPSESR